MADYTKNPRYYGNNNVNTSNKRKPKSGTSGIYKITNDRTGETYIGQSKNIERRIKSHENELRQGTHHNRGMQWDYLSGDTFTYTVLEETSPNRQVLNQKEEKYISQYNSFNQGYNQTPGGQYDKYKGYYGHGGGRLGSSFQQTNSNKTRNINDISQYRKNTNGKNNYNYSSNYSSSYSGNSKWDFLCCLVPFLIFFDFMFMINISTSDFNVIINSFIFMIIINIIIIALISFFKSGFTFNSSKSKKENNNNNNHDVKWKNCAKCGHRLNIVAKKCPYCSSTTFTEYHEKEPIKIVVENPRKIAQDPGLYERQKELAKKYNQNNYKNLTSKPEEKKRVEEMKKVKGIYKVCPNCNHKQGKTNKICPNCGYYF